METITYTSPFAEFLAPLLVAIRSIGFFEAHVFIPSMTVLGVLIFVALRRQAIQSGTFLFGVRSRLQPLFLFGYFTLCFLVTNSTAVAFKTMIVEETDYEAEVWYLFWVSPLHFYISSVAGAMIWLVWRNRNETLDQLLALYVQVGLLAGYYTAYFRISNEPFEWTDVTTGMSGLFFALWFGLLNWDLAIRQLDARAIKSRRTTRSIL